MYASLPRAGAVADRIPFKAYLVCEFRWFYFRNPKPPAVLALLLSHGFGTGTLSLDGFRVEEALPRFQ